MMASSTSASKSPVDANSTPGSIIIEHPQQVIDPRIQKRAMLKFDTVILGCFGILYLLANLDRNNLGATNIMGLPEELGLKGNEFGNAVSLFYATYVVFETPCSIILKMIGPKYLLSTCMLGWGSVCLGMGFVRNAGQLYACRLLLGLFEAGLIPCINTYIGMVYLKSEMSLRSAVYYAFSAIAGAFGGLLASGVSKLTSTGLQSWSWLFIIEGIITVAFVPVIFCAFPKDPRTAWFLNAEERAVMRLRHEANPHLSIEDEFSWGKVASAFKDPKLALHAIIQFSVDISLFSFTTFLPAIIKGMGYTSIHAQLLTVPVYVWATIAYFIIAYMSDRTGLRGPFIIGGLVFLIIGYTIMLATENVIARYIACYILAVGIYPTTGIAIVWLNSNFAGHYKRATAVGATFTIGNTAGVVVGQIFTTSTAPRYLPGVRIALGLGIFAIAVICLMMAGLYKVNKKRKERLTYQAPGIQAMNNFDSLGDYSDSFVYNL